MVPALFIIIVKLFSGSMNINSSLNTVILCCGCLKCFLCLFCLAQRAVFFQMNFFYSEISSLGLLFVFSVLFFSYFYRNNIFMQKNKKIIGSCTTACILFFKRIKPIVAFLAICVGYWAFVLLVSISLSYLAVYFFGPYSPRTQSVATAIIVWTGYVVVAFLFMSTYTFSEEVPAPRREGSKFRLLKARRNFKTKR